MKNGKGLQGQVTVGGDKSISHRVIMLASMAKGTSRVSNLSHGADIGSTLDVYQRLGTQVRVENGTIELISQGVEALNTRSDSLDCGNSGTTLRLSMGILAGTKINCNLAGDESLNKRPVHRVIEPLKLMGADLETVNGDHPPVILRGKKLHGINCNTKIASAQVKSAVLLAGLHAEGVTSVTEPEKSRDHTEIMLKHLGCNIDVEGKTVILSPNKAFIAFEYVVPGDVSTAVFFVVGALIVPDSRLVIRDVLLNPTRTGAIEILRSMGASIVTENPRELQGEMVGDLVVQSSPLRGTDTHEIPTATFIDEVPALAVAAMFAEGDTIFRNISELRVKESNRAQGIVDVLAAYGCQARLDKDDLIVTGGYSKQGKNPQHKGDHRLAMMIEVINVALYGSLIGDFQNPISVSAPEFYEQFSQLVR